MSEDDDHPGLGGEHSTDVGPKPDENAGNGTGETGACIEALPLAVEAIMAQHPRVAGLFAGTASGTGPDGRPLGKKTTTPESYDYAFVVALVRYHLRDADLLATALKLRPGGHVAANGDAYIARVIVRALESADPIGGSAASSQGHTFTVEDVTVFDGDPPVFTLVIKVGAAGGIAITFETAQLIDPRQFVGRCFEKLRVFVSVPEEWREAVEGWMKSARVVTPPPEGTHQGSIIRAVRRAVARLCPGESLADIRDGRGVIAQQRGTSIVLFEIEAVMAALRSRESKPEVEEVAQALYKIGATHGRRTVTLAGKSQKTPKCWAIKAPKDLLPAALPFTTGLGGKVIPFARPSQDVPELSGCGSEAREPGTNVEEIA